MTALPSLIPLARARRADRARRRARWASAVAVAAAITATLCLPALFQSGARYLTLGEEARSLDKAIAELESRFAALQAETTAARSELEIAESVTAHPDWSLLFPILSQTIAGHARIEGLSIVPAERDERGYTLTLRGSAPTTRAVSDLALTLEATPLVQHARVDGATRTPDNTARFIITTRIAPLDPAAPEDTP